jgi:hypothetical protein
MTLTTAPDPTQPGPDWEGPEPETAALVSVAKPEAITPWEALAHQIAQASQQAETKKFDYRTPVDNKAARAWIAHLRRLAGSIERHRKDAKAVHLERGRAVDNTAKALDEAVRGLIEPHARELDKIAAEEEFRIAQHRAVLDRIAALPEGVTTSAEAEARLQQLAAIDTSVLEDFRTAGEARHADAQTKLLELRDTLRQQEADQAELEALRAERAAREQAERDERIRQEAIEAERRQAAEAAQRAEAERQARERAEIERQAREQAEAQRREQAAIAAAEAARQAQEAAEQREREAVATAEAARAAEEARQAAEALRIQQAEEAQRLRRDALCQELADVIGGLQWPQAPLELAECIISGKLHPAITIDWSKA